MAHIQRDIDPYQIRKYQIRIDGMAAVNFSKADPISEDSAVSKYREGDWADYPIKQPGMLDYKELTFERGEFVGGPTVIEEWVANKTRKTIEVVRLNHEQDEESRPYRLFNAFPKGFETGDFDAQSEDGLAIMKLTIAYEYATYI